MMLNFANILAEAVSVAAPEAVSADATAATATATAAGAAGDGGLITTVLMMVAMVAIFYFLLIRPQRKKDKQVKDMLAALKVGDRVCTIGGLYGTIAAVKDNNITLTLGSLQNTIVVARWAIRSVENEQGPMVVENDSEPQI